MLLAVVVARRAAGRGGSSGRAGIAIPKCAGQCNERSKPRSLHRPAQIQTGRRGRARRSPTPDGPGLEGWGGQFRYWGPISRARTTRQGARRTSARGECASRASALRAGTLAFSFLAALRAGTLAFSFLAALRAGTLALVVRALPPARGLS